MASWIILLTLGAVLPVLSFADDVGYASLVQELQPETPSSSALFSEFKYSPQPQSEIDAMTHYGQDPRIVDLNADSDSHMLARISKARSLSVLTVAETDQARLFVGVNGDGVFGLHFRAIPRRAASRHLEFLRMPYLENHAQASEHGQLEANPD